MVADAAARGLRACRWEEANCTDPASKNRGRVSRYRPTCMYIPVHTCTLPREARHGVKLLCATAFAQRGYRDSYKSTSVTPAIAAAGKNPSQVGLVLFYLRRAGQIRSTGTATVRKQYGNCVHGAERAHVLRSPHSARATFRHLRGLVVVFQATLWLLPLLEHYSYLQAAPPQCL